MEILRSDLSRCAELDGAVVVIDVLRSFSTAAYALAAGAAAVIAAESIEAAHALRARHRGAITVGALGGGAPIPDFDVGNSPSALAGRDVAGRIVIQYTEGGIRGLIQCRRATPVLAASLVCARATARHVRDLASRKVTLVVTGSWVDRDGDEDHACADRIEALLRGGDPPAAQYAARVRASDFGRRFAAGGDPSLPAADLEYCVAVDRFDFAMPVRRVDGGLMIEAAVHLAGVGGG